tara:strand:- start:1731 stop:2384 length:654 start_codon:yes stop_codon:yes gene_type:complete
MRVRIKELSKKYNQKYNHPHLDDPEGQMYDFERRKLWQWVHDKKPSVVFEIGTGGGGGSTIQIAHAIKTLREEGHCAASRFFTCEPDMQELQKASKYFSTHPEYKGFVTTECECSTPFINDLINVGIIPDFIFFDGPEIAELSLSDFKILEHKVKIGTMFATHDWDTTNSVKNLLLRPYLEANENWKQVEYLSGISGEWPNETETQSVGLALYQKTK